MQQWTRLGSKGSKEMNKLLPELLKARETDRSTGKISSLRGSFKLTDKIEHMFSGSVANSQRIGQNNSIAGKKGKSNCC